MQPTKESERVGLLYKLDPDQRNAFVGLGDAALTRINEAGAFR